jgi:hypothetical protein
LWVSWVSYRWINVGVKNGSALIVIHLMITPWGLLWFDNWTVQGQILGFNYFIMLAYIFNYTFNMFCTSFWVT